ncbi:radical SAM protein [Methanothermococcus okinawensis]|uniref:Radical SAM domain protein n=1 Tax=Methanothermococcus okinawensis (strain DSM 14208 / JCM 11175 / IH1) TaxID=647113 RepID=F8AMP6_METOI|nr:radical SAM protein [Methanothermococcus okinawensis]AEH06877.1 Radical SAM domain protein [Methanothermococcus okinawensis IH1]
MKYLILKITNRCNLNCIYCYANNYNINRNIKDNIHKNKKNKDMAFKTAKKAIDYILEIDDNLKIQFTGGEPLLNFKLIEDTVNYCNKSYSGKNISFAIQTNGTLTDENIIKKLKKLNVAIGISLDTIDIHDNILRPYKDGNSSTLDTLRGIYLLKNNNIPFGITSVITNKNLPYIKDFVEYLMALGVNSISFDLLKPKKKEHLQLLPNEDEFNRILMELKNYPIYIKNLQKRPNDRYCYLNSGDLLFVNELGDIYPCPTLEGHLYMGNIHSINKEKLKLFKIKCNYCFARRFLINKLINLVK